MCKNKVCNVASLLVCDDCVTYVAKPFILSWLGSHWRRRKVYSMLSSFCSMERFFLAKSSNVLFKEMLISVFGKETSEVDFH